MNRYRFVAVLSAFAAASSYFVCAQNIDPTVVVTNSFQTRIVESHKPEQRMAVPDSMNRFDLNFDYSVFDKPYKGSYVFSPYLLNMKPEQGNAQPRRFYLNTGIGYTLRPVFDLVWSPVSKKNVALDIYAGHHSFIGNYQKIGRQPSSGDVSLQEYRRMRDENNKPLNHGGKGLNGVDMQNEAGLNFRYDWDSVTFTAGGGYEGIYQKDFIGKHSFNEGNAYVRVYSKTTRAKRFLYDVGAKYSFASDKSLSVSSAYPAASVSGSSLESASASTSGPAKISQHNLDFDASLGAGLTDSSKVAFDFGLDLNAYSGYVGYVASSISFTPHYVLSKKGWRIDLGARVSGLISSFEAGDNNSTSGQQFIYPAIDISYNILKAAMRFDVKVTGGERLNSYSSLMRDHRHYNVNSYALMSRLVSNSTSILSVLPPLVDNSFDRINASFGLSGRVGNKFGYAFRAGYAIHGKIALDRVFICGLAPSAVAGGTVGEAGGTDSSLNEVDGFMIDYAKDLHELYASLNLFAEFDWMRLSGGFLYRYVDKSKLTNGLFAPADFSGSAEALFNIKRRVYLGIDCEFATPRKSTVNTVSFVPSLSGVFGLKIPGYADLGISAEYQYNRKLSFWLRGSNLLCMSIQRTPLYAETGISFTGGICLNF